MKRSYNSVLFIRCVFLVVRHILCKGSVCRDKLLELLLASSELDRVYNNSDNKDKGNGIVEHSTKNNGNYRQYSYNGVYKINVYAGERNLYAPGFSSCVACGNSVLDMIPDL